MSGPEERNTWKRGETDRGGETLAIWPALPASTIPSS